MEEFISSARIANAILQDKDFSGHYILVEGKKDINVYRKFVLDGVAKIRPTFGKYKLREAYKILCDRGFERKIGIRDADFLRIKGNIKFDIDFKDDVFVTDHHDSELMIVESGSFRNFLFAISDEEKISKFELIKGMKIKEIMYALAYNLGCLKLANKKFKLGLSFKPERPDGNKLKFSKFINYKNCEFLGNAILINTVVEYSKNRGNLVSNRDVINEKLLLIIAENYEITELINGHDVAEVLLILAKHGLGSVNKTLQDSNCVENMLALAFDLVQFSKTNLFQMLKKWEHEKNVQLFETA